MINWINTPQLDKISIPRWMYIKQYTPLQQAEIDSLINKHIWVTADRRQIKVSDMATSHIRNCIAAFEQGRIWIGYLGGKDKWVTIFHRELLKRT